MSRPTLYRYLARYTKAREKIPTLPEVIDSSGKVNLDVLFEFVSWRKARDKRGFPLGQNDYRLRLGLTSLRMQTASAFGGGCRGGSRKRLAGVLRNECS
jgi:hypothetical protein